MSCNKSKGFNLVACVFLAIGAVVFGATAASGDSAQLPSNADANAVLLIQCTESTGSVADISKNKNRIVLNNVTVAKGKSADALCFNGKDAFVDVPDFCVSGYDAFTIDFLIKPAKYGKQNMTILRDGTVPGLVRLAGYIDPFGKIIFRIYDCASNPYATSKSVMPIDDWTQISVTAKKSGYLKLYVNGMLEDTVELKHWTPFGSFKIGDAVYGTLFFNGCIEGVHVFDTERVPKSLQ
jgi:hypothetical protein